MPIVFDGPVEPDAITTFVREVPVSDGFILNELLPDRTFDDNEVEWEELVKTNRTARYRTYDGRIHVSSRDGASSRKVKLPPLSSSQNTGEYERLQIQFARTGGTRMQSLERAIYDDSENLTGEILNRAELAKGDTLTDFKFTMMGPSANEPGLEADYGAPAGHLVSPATQWTDDANASILSDLVTWTDTWVADNNGSRPGAYWTSLRTQRLMQRNKEIIDAVHGATAGRTRVTQTELTDLLESEGLPAVRTYDGKVDVDGVTTPVIPEDRFLIVPANRGDLGYMAWGLTATALELVDSDDSEMSFEQAPGIVGVIVKEGPPYRQFVFVDAVGMPVITNPRGLMVADVF